MDFLATVDGTLDQFPPLRVLALAHRVKATGRLVVQSQHATRTIELDQARVVFCTGFDGLVPGGRGDLGAQLGAAIASGTTSQRALELACTGLGAALTEFVGAEGGHVRFETVSAGARQRMVLPMSVPQIIASGLRVVRPVEVLRRVYSHQMSVKVRARLPDDAPESRWGLDPVALRLVREGLPGLTVRELAKDDASLLALDLLIQMGIFELPNEDHGPVRFTARPGGRPAGREAAPGPRSAPREEVGPVVPPGDATAQKLAAALEELRGASALEVLGIKRSADVSEPKISAAFREVSGRFHPDRFASASAVARDLAAGCFSVVNDAWGSLKSPDDLAEARERLKAAEEGRVFVTEADRQKARVTFARGEILFRNKQWNEALPLLEQAAKMDSTVWRYAFYRVECALNAERMSPKDALAALSVLQPPPGAARADVLATAGELLLREGDEDAAYTRFEEALRENPEHIGARRRMRLRDMRGESAEAKPSGSWWSRLLKRGD